jgi:hypothetical protein
MQSPRTFKSACPTEIHPSGKVLQERERFPVHLWYRRRVPVRFSGAGTEAAEETEGGVLLGDRGGARLRGQAGWTHRSTPSTPGLTAAGQNITLMQKIP